QVEIRKVESGDALVAARLFFPIEIFRSRDRNLIETLAAEFFEEQDQIFRRFERQGPNQQRVNQAEDGGVGADRQSDGDDGDGREAGGFEKGAKSETDG